MATFQVQGPVIPQQEIDNNKFRMPIITNNFQSTSSRHEDSRSSVTRAICNLNPVTSISMPSVITATSNNNGNLYIPPRLQLSNKDIEDITNGTSSLSDINNRELIKPLDSFDAYMDRKAVELKCRANLRKIRLTANPNKTQICNALVAADEAERKLQQQEQPQAPPPPPQQQQRRRKRGVQQMNNNNNTNSNNHNNGRSTAQSSTTLRR
jgi:hypothetical protein